MSKDGKKIALVADWITHWGGAERIFVKLMEMYPEAEIYTSVFFPERPEAFRGRKIHTSFLQYIPFLNRRHKLCMLLRPLAFWSFNFQDYDLVISSSSAEAKGIYTAWKTKHVCYCHTPTRYLWSHSEAYKNFLEFGWLNWLARMVIPFAFRTMKKWDYRAAQRPDIFIANSLTTQSRIATFYERESTVVYPFFNQKHDLPLLWDRDEYYVSLGRIVPYKRVDLAIAACNQLWLRLKIFTNTNNSESRRLQKISWPTIEWIFGASDREVGEGLQKAQGFIMPQVEDFWIVALEAMSYGVPVIAYGEGGATETVIHGKTWLLFSQQTTESLMNALEKSREIPWDNSLIQEQSNRFSEERFETEFSKIVNDIII